MELIKRVRLTLSVALVVSSAVTDLSAAEQERTMYRCQDGTQVVFSGQPCGPTAEAVDINYAAPSSGDAASAESRDQRMDADTERFARQSGLDEEIAASEERIESLEDERDQRVAELAARRDAGTEDADDATWYERLTGEMRATSDQYATRIEAEQARLSDLREQRAALE